MSHPEGLTRARAQLLEISARLLIREVGEQALRALVEPTFLDALESYEPGVRDYLEQVARDPKAGLERIAVDFCALFLAKPATSPYASAWVTANAKTGARATPQQLLQSVEGWMRELGMEIAPGEWGNVPRDHVAVLVAHALYAGPRGLELAAEIREQALPWVADFRRAVCERTANPLYRATVRMLTDALDDL